MRVDAISGVAVKQNAQQALSRESRPVARDNALDKTVFPQNGGGTAFTEEELISAIERANDKLELYEKRLEFSIPEKTKQIMIKIINTETDEVIKEIPPEKILDMVARFMEMAGLLVDEKA